MIASIVSLLILSSGLSFFTRYSYLLGRDGLEAGPPSRRYWSFLVSGLFVILLAGFLNKSLE